jgi:hypothetical protein
VALIEVDLEAPHDLADHLPPVHRYRWVGLAVVAVMLCTLGGAAPAAESVLWQRLGSIPLGASGYYTLADDGEVVTLDDGVVAGWRPAKDSVARQWTGSLPETPGSRAFAGGGLRWCSTRRPVACAGGHRRRSTWWWAVSP